MARAADANSEVVSALSLAHPGVEFVPAEEVFCEKPLAVDVAEGRKMVAAGGVTAVNFPLSDTNATLYLEDAIPDADALRVQEAVEAFYG